MPSYHKHALALLSVLCCINVYAQPIGIFDESSDVGAVLIKGKSVYRPSGQQYTISGAGANIWFASDQFQFLWKKLSGDFMLHARAGFLGKGTDPHRKTGWMIRSALDSNAAMISATVHGDGLTSLQYRKSKGGNVEEVRSLMKGPGIIQLQRKGNTFIMSVAADGDTLQQQQVSVEFPDNVFAGLFVCSHNKDMVETVVFDNVRIARPARDQFVPYREYIGSHVELMDITTGIREIIYSDTVSLQAPNWMKNGKSLIYNSKGLIYQMDIKKPVPRLINTDFVKSNNNDHVISFDGKMLGLSSSSGGQGVGSLIYVVPIKGGKPKQIIFSGPSYLHGWSPDGKHLVYTAQRNNEFDIYRIPAKGGEEVNITKTAGLDDGPEYSPDGKYIYFNSSRAGNMQLWRMNADGSNQQQLTFDSFNNWFPHISPDGRTIVFLSFLQDVNPDDHPFYKHVYIRIMPVPGAAPAKPKVIAYVYGGQGTINTPSWSPDSKKFAFVSNSDILKTW